MALAECMTGYAREMFLRMIFFDATPPWEDDVNGTTYTWTPTEFRINLHKTGDPGEAATNTTNLADYTGYVEATVDRDSTEWTLGGSGGVTPQISNTNAMSWPQNTGTDQDIYAVSISMRSGGVNYPMARDAFSPVTVVGDASSGDVPRIGSGGLTYALR